MVINMFKRVSIFFSVMVIMIVICTMQALAAGTTAPDPADITVTNNLAGTPDTVTVTNLTAYDIVKVYTTASGGTPIGVTVAFGTSATVYISQLGLAGTAYVTVTSGSSDESARTAVGFSCELKATAPLSADISIQNNKTGNLDIVSVSNLDIGDIVRVYSASYGPATLGTGVSTGASVDIYINQIGIAASSVFVTVQGINEVESDRTAATYSSEITPVLLVSSVTVTNNYYTETSGAQTPGTEDTVAISGAEPGDIVNIYQASLGTATWISPMTVANADIVNGIVTIKIAQLGTTAGKIYVTITETGKAESKRVLISFAAEPVTTALKASSVTVTNNFNAPDIVDIIGLAAGDTVNIYTSQTDTTPIGTGTETTGTLSITINSGVLSITGGKIYVTVTSLTANESARMVVGYVKEVMTTAPAAANITVVNNYLTADTITVTGLTAGYPVKVYATLTSTAPIASGIAGNTPTVTLAPGILSAAGGRIYVTVTSTTANESARTAVSYAKEVTNTAPALTSIAVSNNYLVPDTIAVSGLKAGDVIKVYGTSTSTVILGTDTVTGTTALITLASGVLSANGGNVYLTLTSPTANESTRTTVPYAKEVAATAPDAAHITVLNKYLAADIITVTGLSTGDIVKVYSSLSGTIMLGSGTETGGTATITLNAGVLSAGGGKIYISVTSVSANESSRTTFTYDSEKSTAPLASSVTVTNNYYTESAAGQDPGTEDTVAVSGVIDGDIITIYKALAGTEKLAGPVTASGVNTVNGTITITISQLGTKAGKLYVTVTKTDKAESTRTAITYTAEPATTALVAANITVANNYKMDDVVTVTGIITGQIVSVYTSPTAVTPIASRTATGNAETFILQDGILSAGTGKVYVTVKDADKFESARMPQLYTAEVTIAPKTSNILVVNYLGSAYDTVTLVGLSVGDTVTIYSTATGTTILAVETVTGKGTTLTLATNLPDTAGTVYITVTGTGKAESSRVAVQYLAA
jgi:trimeric autotransporter adhesin